MDELEQEEKLYAEPEPAEYGSTYSPDEIRPLRWGSMLLYPLLYRSTPPQARSELELRRKRTIRKREEVQAYRAIKRQVKKEARLFAEIILATWERQGFYHRPRGEFDGPERYEKKRQKKRRVKFERIICSEYEIYFKIRTRERGMFVYRSALPYGVRVQDLISDETIEELSRACDRKVILVPTDYSEGTWISVQRLQGMDGIPALISFSHLLRWIPDDRSKAPIIVGVGQHRHIHMINLADFPHFLVGGSSGGGKSNWVNTFICTLMWMMSPKEVRFILIDLKMGLEFGFYRNAVHLERPIVTEAADAIETLKSVYNIMRERMMQMAAHNVKDLTEWNKAFPSQQMPRLVVIVDEFAELRLSDEKGISDEAERLARRIANLGRAAGVHLILCTQRPATDTISNGVKVNMSFIMGFRVQSEPQSRVLLNRGRADELPQIKGRGIYETGQQCETVQTPYIRNAEVIEAVQIARGVAHELLVLKGIDPVLNFNALLKWVIDRGGLLSKKVGDQLRDFGITAQMWREFVLALEQQNNVIKRGNKWFVKDMPPIPAGPLLLPAPTPTKPTGEPMEVYLLPAPEDPVIDAREYLTASEAVTRFLDEACEFDKRYREKSAAVLAAFKKFCEQFDCEEVGATALTRLIKAQRQEIGTTKKRDETGQEARWITGLRLRATVATDMPDTTVATDDLEHRDGEDLAA